MTRTLVILALAVLTLVFITLLKTYTRVPKKELKRRARDGDALSKQLYSAAAYDLNLKIMLWTFIGLSTSGFFVCLVKWLPAWAALVSAMALIWLGFAWLPKTRVGKPGLLITRWLTPPLAWLLHNFSPGLSAAARFIKKHGRIDVHTGIYEKEDLIALIKHQKKIKDSRMSKQELDIAANALSFSDLFVRDAMVPRRMVKTVSATDTIGPILMNELHDSGHSRFPVYEGKKDNIIGTLFLHDLLDAKEGGQVGKLMNRRVYYVNDSKTLDHVLQAFLKTKHQQFVVVNNFEEMVGVISIEDIFEKILGSPIVDEFDKYEDLRAVATIDAEKEKEEHSDSQEVVE